MRYTGRCWKFGDNIPTDRLVKSRYVFEPMDEIVKHVLEDLNPEFPDKVQPGDIVVAGRHFGQSSGRAIATKALQATGTGCVVADSLARTFYRNCFEIGLPVFGLSGVSSLVSDGDQVAVDIERGDFHNLTTGGEHHGSPADPFLLEMLRAGGLIKLAAQRPDLFDE
ncbi:MAG: hypothetical protein J2P20_00025 [Pseudonocardia sp.]|nr:hypothetical protein [Pseudonocardia sp.]